MIQLICHGFVDEACLIECQNECEYGKSLYCNAHAMQHNHRPYVLAKLKIMMDYWFANNIDMNDQSRYIYINMLMDFVVCNIRSIGQIHVLYEKIKEKIDEFIEYSYMDNNQIYVEKFEKLKLIILDYKNLKRFSDTERDAKRAKV